ncbi:MAG: DUF2817 domain-containing protein [Marinagarivorans sp.]|nr:DUF2817 domain-containing protein [Marinagarivorans sp.]
MTSAPTAPPKLQLETRHTQVLKRSPSERKALKIRLPEMLLQERLMRKFGDLMRVNIEHSLHWQDQTLPIYSLTLGNIQKDKPTLLLTAGMHGIERIGSQVLIAWLQSLCERLRWDNALKTSLQNIQLVVMPILNPVGMYNNTRSNGNHVDLNRNAPIDAEDSVPLLGGGHRLSGVLPWYRGKKGTLMEAENLALERLIQRQITTHPLAIVLDLHSGFGSRDRLWFPYAYRRKAIGNISSYMALKLLWERSFPHHTYIFEPQSQQYLSHGDVWDYFYQQAKPSACNFMPLTLEMGSWAWVKKRPQQLFNLAGLFNPQASHRQARVLRRHMQLLDFLIAASQNPHSWLPDQHQKNLLEQTANSIWYS